MSVENVTIRVRNDQPDDIRSDSQVLPLYSQGGNGEPVANKARPSVQVLASAGRVRGQVRKARSQCELHIVVLTRITLGKSSRVGQRELHVSDELQVSRLHPHRI
jgi:hypothetical protein